MTPSELLAVPESGLQCGSFYAQGQLPGDLAMHLMDQPSDAVEWAAG